MISVRQRFQGAAVSCCLLASMASNASPVLDQHNDTGMTYTASAVANDRSQVQTFTVGSNGSLSGVQVEVSKSVATFEDLVISLWSTGATGRPETLLVSQSFAPDLVSFTRSFLAWELGAQAFAVAAGEVLAIVLTTDASNAFPFNQRYNWGTGGQYAGGQAYTVQNGNYALRADDFRFRTFLEVPEPNPTALVALALFALVLSRVPARPKRR